MLRTLKSANAIAGAQVDATAALTRAFHVRRVRVSLLVIGGTAGATVLLNVALAQWWSLPASLLVLACCLGCALWIRRHDAAPVAFMSNVILATSALSISWASWIEVPTTSTSPYYFLMLVPAAGNMAGIPAARTWAAIAGVLVLGLHGAERALGVSQASSAQLLAHASDPLILLACEYFLLAAAWSATEGYERDLRRTNAALVKADHAKDMFLANTSHELRTPLNGVLGMTDLLLDTPLSRDQHELASTIRASGSTLVAVINDLLDISKCEAGKLTVELEPTRVEPIVEEVLQLFAASAAAKGIEVVGGCDPGVPQVIRSAPTRLRQVLSNLVANAVKFTTDGEVRLRVALRGDRVRFEVEDSGPGIEPSALRRLFQPFEQVDRSTTRAAGGTGLGLAISKSLVELMGGTIAVRSEVGVGSTFWFELPATPIEPAPEVEPRPLAGRRVALVNVRGTTADLIQAHLAHAGMTTVRARLGDRIAEVDLVIHEGDAPVPGRTPAVALVAIGAVTNGWAVTKPVRRVALLEEIGRALALGPRATGDPRPASPPTREQPLAGCHVLVAEDNTVNQKIALRFLERLGATVDLAENGAAAVDRLCGADGPFDVVLMDCQMPVMDGFEATRALRRLEAGTGRRTPVLALTANALPADVARCWEAQMDAHLAKPYNLPELLRALTDLGVGRGAHPALASSAAHSDRNHAMHTSSKSCP